jgi:hypothetical protein
LPAFAVDAALTAGKQRPLNQAFEVSKESRLPNSINSILVKYGIAADDF